MEMALNVPGCTESIRLQIQARIERVWAATTDSGGGGERLDEDRQAVEYFRLSSANRSRLKWKCARDFVNQL